MLKLLSRLTNLVFIANYGLGGIAFVYYVNRHDTGQWDSNGWNFILGGGLISGALALLFQKRLYRKLNLESQTLLIFLFYQMVYGVIFMMLTVAVGSLISLVILSLSRRDFESLALILVLPFFIMIFLFKIASLGIAVGLINGILLQGIHILQARNRQNEHPQ